LRSRAQTAILLCSIGACPGKVGTGFCEGHAQT
jgi:hypothetical protein